MTYKGKSKPGKKRRNVALETELATSGNVGEYQAPWKQYYISSGRFLFRIYSIPVL